MDCSTALQKTTSELRNITLAPVDNAAVRHTRLCCQPQVHPVSEKESQQKHNQRLSIVSIDCSSVDSTLHIAKDISKRVFAHSEEDSNIEVVTLQKEIKRDIMEEEKQLSGQELMNSMVTFKKSIKKSMSDIGKDINDKIDIKLNNLDKGLTNLTEEVRSNNAKQEKLVERLENRLSKLEVDVDRVKFARMKERTGGRLDGKSTTGGQKEGPQDKIMSDAALRRDIRADKLTEDDSRPARRTVPTDHRQDQPITRTRSWAEEVEESVGLGITEQDHLQWSGDRRTLSDWADRLNGQVREAAGKVGTRRDRMEKGMTAARGRDRIVREQHCRREDASRICHLFGDSSAGESSSNSSGIEDDWDSVGREEKNRERRRRAKERRKKKKVEIASKARRMAGLGPIMDEQIRLQMSKTKNYEKAKIWAVKEHLATCMITIKRSWTLSTS